jgi:post-segregation antitoxin (ccd killing protein)
MIAAMSLEDGGRFKRRTITLPADLDAAISAVATSGEVSAFVQRAVLHELQRERVATWLDQRVAARSGQPLSAAAVKFAETAWRKRKT